jgi:hypothetical protein
MTPIGVSGVGHFSHHPDHSQHPYLIYTLCSAELIFQKVQKYGNIFLINEVFEVIRSYCCPVANG